jgi:hypothetical protein
MYGEKGIAPGCSPGAIPVSLSLSLGFVCRVSAAKGRRVSLKRLFCVAYVYLRRWALGPSPEPSLSLPYALADDEAELVEYGAL